MALKRRWPIVLVAALMVAAAFPVHAQAGPGGAPVTTSPGPMFCGEIFPETFIADWCLDDYMACINGYDPGSSTYTPCPWGGSGYCLCYNVEVFPLPDPAACYPAYAACMPVGDPKIPPPASPGSP